eukprot:360804-Chlamydomonas_euryale.AAC.8
MERSMAPPPVLLVWARRLQNYRVVWRPCKGPSTSLAPERGDGSVAVQQEAHRLPVGLHPSGLNFVGVLSSVRELQPLPQRTLPEQQASRPLSPCPCDCSDNDACPSTVGSGRVFMEAGGVCPSALPGSDQSAVLRAAAAAVRAFDAAGGLSGVFHFEALWDAHTRTVMPLELNVRVGGAETWSNVRAAWGLDLAAAAVRVALGLPPRLPQHLAAHLAAHLAVPMARRGGDVDVGGDLCVPYEAAPLRAVCAAVQPWGGPRAGGRAAAGAGVFIVHRAGPAGHELAAAPRRAAHRSQADCATDGFCIKAPTEAVKGEAWAADVAVCGGQVVSVPALCFVVSLNLVPEWEGVALLQECSMGAEALGDAALVDFELYLRAGQLARLPPAGFSPLGWVSARSGESRLRARAALSRIVARHLALELVMPP